MAFCWIHRLVISNQIESEKRLPDWVERHLGSCPRCRDYHQAQTALGQLLSSQALAYRKEPSPFLASKIMAAASGKEERLFAHPAPWKRAIILLTAVSAVAISLVLILTRQDNPPAMAEANPPGKFAEPLPLLREWPSGTTLISWSQSLDRPLQSELNSVVQDAKKAVDLLAKNFLPEPLLANPAASRLHE